MSMLGSLGDVVGGFNKQSDSIRQDEQAKQAATDARDSKLFDALANADDPEIRAAAVTGLLTGSHPAKGMDKWFGKMQQHPAYEQIKGLVAEGHQPFLGTEGSEAAKTAGMIKGRVSGAVNAVNDNAGSWPSQDFIERVSAGAAGAPQKAAGAAQYGTVKLKDGSTVAGYFDPTSKQYMGENGEPVTDAIGFSHSGSFGAQPTDKWAPGVIKDTGQFPGESNPGGWRIKMSADGKTVVDHVPAQPPPEAVPNIAQTPTGAVGVGRGGREVPLPSAVTAGRASTPTESLASVRATQASVLKDAGPEPKQIGFLKPSAPDIAAWEKKRDAAAVKYGYANYAALQAQLGEVQRNVGAATPPPPGPVEAGAGGAPGKKPVAKKPGSPAAGQGGGAIDVDAVLKELGRTR